MGYGCYHFSPARHGMASGGFATAEQHSTGQCIGMTDLLLLSVCVCVHADAYTHMHALVYPHAYILAYKYYQHDQHALAKSMLLNTASRLCHRFCTTNHCCNISLRLASLVTQSEASFLNGAMCLNINMEETLV